MSQDITQGHIREIYKEDSSFDNEQQNNEAAESSGEDYFHTIPYEDSADAKNDISVEPTEEEMSFLHEQVKKDRGFKSWWKVLKYIVIGGVVGAVACIVFYCMSPWAKNTFTPKEEVDIPIDVEPEIVEYYDISELLESSEEPAELDIDSVRQYSAALREVAADVNHSIVTVTGQGDLMGWLDGSYVDPGSASGLIIAETTTEILVLVPTDVVDGAEILKVTFGDGGTCSGTVKKSDHNTGLAVIAVRIDELSATTAAYYKVAVLGNSYGSSKGIDIIVLGSPFGFSGGEAFGTLTGKNGTSSIRDCNFKMLLTSISGAYDESGALFNTSGEVLGFITPNAFASNSSVIAAIPISDIKMDIEKLSNGKGIPYLGIRGEDIDTRTAEEQGLPQGIFVTDVEVDSPAMVGGLQTGDIITEINSRETLTFSVFRSVLVSADEGSIVRIKVLRMGSEGYEPVYLNVTLGVK